MNKTVWQKKKKKKLMNAQLRRVEGEEARNRRDLLTMQKSAIKPRIAQQIRQTGSGGKRG